MPEPTLSISTLLQVAGPAVAEGAATLIGKEVIKAWLKDRRTQRAARRAIKATVDRYKSWPGTEHALLDWMDSPSFENLLLDARLGKMEALTEDRVVRSFVNSGGGVGWGAKKRTRAEALTRTFLEQLFDALAEGPEGQALANRLAEAREQQARAERARILDTADAGRAAAENAEAAIQAVGADVGDIRSILVKLAPASGLPQAFEEAVRQPVFDELTRLLTDGRAAEALALADRSIEPIEAALEHEEDSGGQYANALRPYRQRLLLAAANAASWLMLADEARARVRRAFRLGPIDDHLYAQAAQAAFNATYQDGLRQLLEQMRPDAPERPHTKALFAFLDGDWDSASRLLESLGDARLLSLRAEAEVARVDPGDPDAVRSAANLLGQAECDITLPVDTLSLARASVRLLSCVLQGYTPLTFDRRPLADAVLRRARAALDATPPDSLLRAHAVALLGDAAQCLQDGRLKEQAERELDLLPEEAQSRVFVWYEATPSLDEIEAEREADHIDDRQAALVTARLQKKSGNLQAAADTLRKALYQTADDHERVPILASLLAVLREDGQDTDAETLLSQTPIPDADRWLLAQNSRKPLDFPGAGAFPLDARVLRLVAARLSHETPHLGRAGMEADVEPAGPCGEGAPSEADASEDEISKPSTWTERLVEVLPSRSSYLAHAEALFHDADYEKLLAAVGDLDPEYAVKAADLEATALRGLGQPQEAARTLSDAAERFPESEGLAVNASALLLSLGSGNEAARLLAPRVTEETETLEVLVNYAMALLQVNPGDPDVASQAFDLLRRAYEIAPSQGLAMQVWTTARSAGRDWEATRYLHALMSAAPHVEIRTRADAERALAGGGGGVFTGFTGDVSLFAEVVGEQAREGRKSTDALNLVSTAHALAYVDTFRASGGSWENWTRWTLDAEGFENGGGYSILTDWPSSVFAFGRQRTPASEGRYADPTALMTLGVLGPDTAALLLEKAAPVHVETGTVARLQDELRSIQQRILTAGGIREARVVERFEGTDAVVTYDKAVEEAVPDDAPDTPSRVDLGVAQHLGGRYVSDLDREPAEGANDIVVASASLLATLNIDGRVDNEVAEQAARNHPNTFGGWGEAPVLGGVPGILVFDRFTLTTWVEAELVDLVASTIRIGPWAWTQLLSETRQRRVAVLAHRRLADTIKVLRGATESGHLHELDPVERPSVDEAEVESMEDAWVNALRSVRTAQAHDLQLWADDRFYPLLLWMGGPTLGGPATEAVRAPLLDAAEQILPTPTVGLVARLVRDGVLPEQEARRIAGELFDQGYRPAHPLILSDALDRFVLPEEGALRGRFQALADALAEIPKYIPDSVDLFRRQGFSRTAAAELADQFVLMAWNHPGLSEAQRRLLSDAFLESVEAVFQEQSPDPVAPRSDRTRLLFWRGLSSSIFTSTLQGEDAFERQDAALRWLGDAASQRSDPHHDIVRLLEDNASAVVSLAPSVRELESAIEPDESIDAAQARTDIVGGSALRALVPLLGSRLIDRLDPLLRRTVGMLARLERGGRIGTHIGVRYDGKELETVVPEEEDEAAAIELVRRVLHGDLSLADRVHATDLAFTYNRRTPAKWVKAGVPKEAFHPIEVRYSLFTLLWTDATDIAPALVAPLQYYLSLFDPPLALRLLDLTDDLLSDDEDRRGWAKDALALDLLESGYYELQRDLGHAVWRIRNWTATALARFLGSIGNEEALRLTEVNSPSAPRLVVLGNAVVPESYYFARQLLTSDFDDAEDVLAAVSASAGNTEEPPISDLSAWAMSRMEVAEASNDPFVGAYALRHILLTLRAIGPDASLPMGEEGVEATSWAQTYLSTALADLDPATSLLAQHLERRRRLCRAALQLAAFACQGEHHVDAYNAEEDPLAVWLDRVWLLASRLMLTLPALHGDLERAAVEAERASRDLGLDAPAMRVIDVFDPFELSGAQDLGRTLTLAAIYSSLDAEEGGRPAWWSSSLEGRLNEIVGQSPPVTEIPVGDLGDRFGIGFPLREQDLVRSILGAVVNRG